MADRPGKEARGVVGAGVSEERQSVVRYRLDRQNLDHFLDFTICPHYIQDVAYGTKKLKISTGEVLQIPNVVRTVLIKLPYGCTKPELLLRNGV